MQKKWFFILLVVAVLLFSFVFLLKVQSAGSLVRELVKATSVMLPVFVFLFLSDQIKKPLPSVFTFFGFSLIIAASLYVIWGYIYKGYSKPPEWDFLCFWIDGTVAFKGENFYDARSYQQIFLPFSPSGEFRLEILDVGFKYPPFTMFLFLPLGLFGVSEAFLLWQALILLSCTVCIYGLWRLFLKDYGLISMLLIAILMLIMAPMRATFSFAQTNFFALLFFLFFWRYKAKEWGGFWLAMCVVVKPYMAVLYIYPLLTRKWKMLTFAVLTLSVLAFLSFLVFGPDVFMSYLAHPVPTTPSWNYTELTNQSLLATILRLNQHQLINVSPLLNPFYLGGALVLTFITVLITIKNRNHTDDWVIISILFLALIIYPGNQMFYSVFLIVPVVLLLQNLNLTIKERMVIFFIILLTYLLSESVGYMFYANLLIWIVCIIMAAKLNYYLPHKLRTSLGEVGMLKKSILFLAATVVLLSSVVRVPIAQAGNLAKVIVQNKTEQVVNVYLSGDPSYNLVFPVGVSEIYVDPGQYVFLPTASALVWLEG